MDLLWTSFLNSDWHDWRGSGRAEDRLQKEDWLAAFLKQWELSAPIPAAPEELRALTDLRSFLRRMAEGLVAGSALATADLERLNAAMRMGPVVRQVAASSGVLRLRLEPLTAGWPQVMAEIAASFARTLTEGETARVRICDNPDCLWVFYDETRNRMKRFCSDKECGNLIKVRRFRARQKGAPDSE